MMAKRPSLGPEYRSLIAQYIRKNYGARLGEVREEVRLGMSIIGKRRHIDILCVKADKALALECKFQDVKGTTDEKIPYSLSDLAAMRVPGCLVYAGPGFSSGVIHLLQASSNAVHCLPDPDDLAPIAHARPYGPNLLATWELDHLLAMTFGWWELIPQGIEAPGNADEAAGRWPNLRAYLAQTPAERALARPKRVTRKDDAAPRQAALPGVKK